MLSEHISGEASSGAASRSSTVIFTLPPVVMLITASQLCLMRGRNCMNTFGSGVGRPSFGSRACRCRMAAPASAAPMACSAIWSGVIGNASDIVGVWIDPVTAQVMMTLLLVLTGYTPIDHRDCLSTMTRRASGNSCQPKRSARSPQSPRGATSITAIATAPRIIR